MNILGSVSYHRILHFLSLKVICPTVSLIPLILQLLYHVSNLCMSFYNLQWFVYNLYSFNDKLHLTQFCLFLLPVSDNTCSEFIPEYYSVSRYVVIVVTQASRQRNVEIIYECE